VSECFAAVKKNNMAHLNVFYMYQEKLVTHFFKMLPKSNRSYRKNKETNFMPCDMPKLQREEKKCDSREKLTPTIFLKICMPAAITIQL